MFFHPRIGTHYQTGFKGYRTLVLGVKHHCTLKRCPNYEDCITQRNCARYDAFCPAYGDRHDLRLSQSNQIEIDAFLEENDHYPAYSYFTKLMLSKTDDCTEAEKETFWEQVAFANYLQYFCPSPQAPEYEENGFAYRTEDWEAFLELLDALQPEVLFVWNSDLKALLDKKIAAGEIEGLQHFDDFRSETLTINRYLYKIKAKDTPEHLFKAFQRDFCVELSDSEAARLMLNALQQARFRQFSPPIGLRITPAMVEAMNGHIWDRKLTHYLINLMQQTSGLNAIADSFKIEIGKALTGHRIASSFAINYMEAQAIRIGNENQELSWFDLGKTCSFDDVDAVICYITGTNDHLKLLLLDLPNLRLKKVLLLLPIIDSDKLLLDVASCQGLRRITEKNNILLIEIDNTPHEKVRLENGIAKMDIRRSKLAQGISLRPTDYLSTSMSKDELDRLVFNVFHKLTKTIPTNKGERDLALLFEELIDKGWLQRCGKRLALVKGKSGQILCYGLHQSGISWSELCQLFTDENLAKNANPGKLNLEKNDQPTRYYRELFGI